MQMLPKHILPFVILLFVTIDSRSQQTDSVHISTGVIFVSGKPFNRQIFFKSEKDLVQITKFKKWEEIKEILVSPDGQDLLSYHKSDKELSHNLSVLNLSSFQMTKTIKPGYGGDFFWTKDRNILLKWGCGSPCQCFRLYDSNLEKLKEQCDGEYQVFLEENVIVSLPTVYASQGIFKVWSLKEGRLIAESSFKDKYGDYYCSETKMLKGSLLVKLVLDQKGEKIQLEYLTIDDK